MKILSTAMSCAILALTMPSQAEAQEAESGPRQIQLIDTLTLGELRDFLESADYRVLAVVEETNTLRIQGGEDPAFYVELEQCDREPGNRCAAISILTPDGELTAISDSILLDANRGFSGIKIIRYGPERTVFYRRYVRLEGGVTPRYLLRQLVTFELQYRSVARHLRERVSGS